MQNLAFLCLFLCLLVPTRSHAAAPPVINVQPLDQTVVYGGTATFSVSATSGTALSYQWYKDGLLFLDELLTGETRNTLILSNAANSVVGQYFVKVSNAGGTVSSRKATLTLVANSPPVANNDNYSTPEDVSLILPAPGILINDTDVNGQTLTVQLMTNVNQGSLSLNNNGSFTYTPPTNYFGSVSFAYRASDDYPLEFNLSGGDKSEIRDNKEGAQSFRHGTAGGASYRISRIVLYLSRESAVGNGNLNFSIGTGLNSGPIAGSVTAISAASITNATSGASFQTYVIDYSVPVGLFTAGTTYYLNFDNQSGKRVFVEYANANTYANGTYYDDGNNQSKDMRFQIYENATSNPATVTINVAAVNDAPIANNDVYTTLEDVPLNVSAPGILSNDTDVDGDTLTAVLVSSVSNGNLSFNPDGSFTYTPNPNYNGTDNFTYRARDGNALPIVLQQNTSGGSVQEIKSGQKGSQSFRHGTAGGPSYTISKIMLHLSKGGTAPNANLNVALGTGINSGALAGSVVSLAPSSITNSSAGSSYQPYEIVFGTPLGPLTAGTTYYLNVECDASNGQGIYTEYAGGSTYSSGTYYKSASDDGKDMWFQISGTTNFGSTSSVATVTLNVTAVNDPPIANNDTYTMPEDATLTVPMAGMLSTGIPGVGILANDTDGDGDAMTVVIESDVTYGTLTLNADGSFTYTPAPDYNGPDSFTYRATDGSATGNVATVSINVTPVSDPLRFTSQRMTANGFELQVSGPDSSTYIISASTNLTDWTPILTNNVALGNMTFTDTDATNHPVRFYRAEAQ